VISDVAAPSAPEGSSRLITRPFVMVMLAGFAYFVAVGAMMPVLPRYVKGELDGGGLQVGLTGTAFAVSAALCRPWIGRVGDMYGRRILAVGGAALGGVSIMAYGLAGTLPVLLAARLFTGAGEAAFFTGCVTANQDLAPANRRGEAASYYSVSLYGGLAVGPALGETLFKATNYTTVFVVFGLCSLVAALVGLAIPIGNTVAHPPKSDWLHRAALWPGIVLALGLVPLVAYNSFLPLYADSVGFADVGPVLAVYAGLIFTIRIFGARLPDKVGWRKTTVAALAGVASGVGILGLWGSSAAIWIGSITLALGMSLLYPALLTAVMDATPDTERTRAVATFTLFFDVSTGLGAALVGGVVSVGNERSGFVVAGLCAAVGLVALRALRDRIGRPAPAA
jgi:MFS family permease